MKKFSIIRCSINENKEGIVIIFENAGIIYYISFNDFVDDFKKRIPRFIRHLLVMKIEINQFLYSSKQRKRIINYLRKEYPEKMI